MNKIKELQQPLKKEDIEFRIGASGKNSWFTLLAYKTARTDTKRLNEVFGLHWKNRFFYDDKGILCCGISIYDEETKNWVERIDVGTESLTEKEKGSYSDAFKRAGFKFGIGEELYNFPFIFIEKWDNYDNKGRPKFLKNNVKIEEYELDENKRIKRLVLKYNNKTFFSYGKKEDKLTEEDKKEIEKQEKIKEYHKQINDILKKQINTGINKIEIQNSIKKHLETDKVTKCNNIEKLKNIYLHSVNKLKKEK